MFCQKQPAEICGLKLAKWLDEDQLIETKTLILRDIMELTVKFLQFVICGLETAKDWTGWVRID